jgi:FkbM family methyltransferase
MEINGLVKSDKRADEEIIEQIKENGLPVYIYGCGNCGKALFDFLKAYGVAATAFVVDDEYCIEEQCKGIEIKKLSEIKKKNMSKNLLIGFSDFAYGISRISKMHDLTNIFCISNPYLYLQKYDIKWDFVEKNMEKIDETLNFLEDSLSKKIMVAYLNTRINRDYKFLMPYSGCKTYFNKEIVGLSDNECYVDCGAADGDSIESFIESVDGHYHKIYAIEPEEKNFCLLKKKYLTEKGSKICLINKGVWRERGQLFFAKEGSQEFSASNECMENQQSVHVDSLDNILDGERVSFLKLSVQGLEADALLGARKILKRWEPTLAITIFMKPDALITIPQIIKQINARYKFYIRCGEPFFARVILYAKVTK